MDIVIEESVDTGDDPNHGQGFGPGLPHLTVARALESCH